MEWAPVFDGGRAITHYSVEIKEEQREQSGRVAAGGASRGSTQLTNPPSLCVCVCGAGWAVSWATVRRKEVSNSNLTQVTLMDLHPAKTYNLRMFAASSLGRSDASNVLTVTTREAGTATTCPTSRGGLEGGGALSLSDGRCVSPAAPEGPPLDVQLQALSPSSLRVTWRVRARR